MIGLEQSVIIRQGHVFPEFRDIVGAEVIYDFYKFCQRNANGEDNRMNCASKK